MDVQVSTTKCFQKLSTRIRKALARSLEDAAQLYAGIMAEKVFAAALRAITHGVDGDFKGGVEWATVTCPFFLMCDISLALHIFLTFVQRLLLIDAALIHFGHTTISL